MWAVYRYYPKALHAGDDSAQACHESERGERKSCYDLALP